MCGGAAEETASNTVLCPQCLLESAVRCHIRETLPDYFNRMPKSFYQDILMDVQETSGYNCDGGLNDDDIRLAFARVVAKVFGVEVWRSLEENAMKNGKNHFGWELSLDCICDTLLTKRSGALKEAVGLTKLLYDLNIRALRETQLSPHCEDKRAGRYLAMLKQKRAAPDIVIIVRGGMIDEIRSTNPFTQMWIADYDRNCSGDGTDELEVAEERGNSSDMHILYP